MWKKIWNVSWILIVVLVIVVIIVNKRLLFMIYVISDFLIVFNCECKLFSFIMWLFFFENDFI